MPRKTNNSIVIGNQPELKRNRTYETQVKSIQTAKKNKQLKIVVQNCENTQYGRLHTIILPLPAWAGNPASMFLECFDIDTSCIGQAIDLDSLIGKKVGVKFLNNKTPQDHSSVEFIKIKEGKTHGNNAK